MKKFLLLYLAILFLFSSCAPVSVLETPSVDLQKEQKTESLYKDLEKVFVCEDESEEILSAIVYGKTGVESYIPILVVQTEKQEFTFELSECATYYPVVSLSDLTGDGTEEILVSSVRSAMGLGVYTTFVLSVEETGLEVLYRFPEEDFVYAGENVSIPYDELNLGFEAAVLDDFRVKLTYEELQFETILQFENEIAKTLDLHNLDGSPNGKEVFLEFGTFFEIEPSDTNGDSVCEIKARQYFTIGSARNLGVANVVLKFNREQVAFEVTSVEIELLQA